MNEKSISSPDENDWVGNTVHLGEEEGGSDERF